MAFQGNLKTKTLTGILIINRYLHEEHFKNIDKTTIQTALILYKSLSHQGMFKYQKTMKMKKLNISQDMLLDSCKPTSMKHNED